MLYFPSIEPATHPGAVAHCPSLSSSTNQRMLISGTVVVVDLQSDCVNGVSIGNGACFPGFQPGLNWVAGREGPPISNHTYIYRYGSSPPHASQTFDAFLQKQGAFVVAANEGITGCMLDARFNTTGIDCFTKTSMV